MLSWHTWCPFPSSPILRNSLQDCYISFATVTHNFSLNTISSGFHSACQLSSFLVIYQVYASPIPIRLLLDFMRAYNTSIRYYAKHDILSYRISSSWLLAAVGLSCWWRCSVWAPQENRATLENNWPWRHQNENGRCEEWDNRSEAQRPRSNSNIPNNPNNPGEFGPFHSNLLYWYLINQYFIVFAFYFLTQLIFHELTHQLL